MTSSKIIGITVISLIYLFTIFLSQPLSYILNLSSLPISLLCLISGILFFNLFQFSTRVQMGRDFIKKNVLQLAIILLGIKISFSELANVSIQSIGVIIIIFFLIFLTYLALSKFWPLQKELSKLLAIGTSICGVTAIMAASSVLKSKDNDVGIAILIVILWGSITVLTYPFFVEWYFISDIAKGIFLGVGIHDTSQVLAAAMVYSDLYHNDKVLEIATITKLLRNLFLILLIPSLLIYKNRKGNKALNNFTIFKSIKSSIPLFVIGFIFFIIIRTVIDVFFSNSYTWENIIVVLENIITILFGLVLTALGASINLKKIINQGFTPIIIGLIYSLVTFLTVCILIFILGFDF
tara:strand:- start:528 stop:1583 length:1056 start_codon:yes stop_codon:yes gene_type:complete